jgi:HPt (histidine-containing phosphotransfer) domain-containing protein/CheY-like chemotaxis protein
MSLKVLVVEDDPHRAEHISTVLEDADHDVFPLTRFDEATEALSLQRFDAVVVSATAPDADLEEFAAKLRSLESSIKSAGHVAILACAPAGRFSRPQSPIEAFLPLDFEANLFAAAVSRLATRIAEVDNVTLSPLAPRLPIFEAAKFEEQMCSDRELMMEIIELYLAESAKQRQQMQAAMAGQNLAELSRVAHTIKGSLGSLHAPRARTRSQDLESAAKSGNEPLSRLALASLEEELRLLEPELMSFRNA